MAPNLKNAASWKHFASVEVCLPYYAADSFESKALAKFHWYNATSHNHHSPGKYVRRIFNYQFPSAKRRNEFMAEITKAAHKVFANTKGGKKAPEGIICVLPCRAGIRGAEELIRGLHPG